MWMKHKKKIEKIEKKIKMADSKKTEFFKIANSQYVFVKISFVVCCLLPQ